jgi:hypothetical protein
VFTSFQRKISSFKKFFLHQPDIPEQLAVIHAVLFTTEAGLHAMISAADLRRGMFAVGEHK